MLEFKIYKTKVRLCFSFFAVLAAFAFPSSRTFGLAAIAACGIHEFSHLLVMLLFGISPEIITFYGAGIQLNSTQTDNASTRNRILILSAGCAANFIAAAAFGLYGNAAASVINLLTGVFNLLPIGELDGAALLKMLFIRICRPERVDNALMASGVVSAAIYAAVVIASGSGVSLTLITTLIYIVIVCFFRD